MARKDQINRIKSEIPQDQMGRGLVPPCEQAEERVVKKLDW